MLTVVSGLAAAAALEAARPGAHCVAAGEGPAATAGLGPVAVNCGPALAGDADGLTGGGDGDDD